MTLYDIISATEGKIARQPNVRSLIRADIYKLDNIPNCLYSAMGWTMGTHRIDSRNGIATYSINLYYIDRNIAEANNEHMIVSYGIQVIGNIIQSLANDGIYFDSYDVQPFIQSFHDDCAGVYATLSIDAPIDGCYQDYIVGDFNNDFNNDFDVDSGGHINLY